MERVLQEKKLEILQGVLARLESTEAKVESALFLKPKEREHLQDVGLLEPHTAEFAESGGKSNAELVRLSELGIRIVFWNGDEEGLEVYKIEMAALREQIKKLDRKGGFYLGQRQGRALIQLPCYLVQVAAYLADLSEQAA